MHVRVILEPPVYRAQRDSLRWLRLLLLTIAIGALGYTAYVYLDARIYQAREDRIIDESSRPAEPVGKARVPEDSLIGRIEIPRLQVRAIVEEGVGSTTLRRAVGHVPGTAMPGETGNVGLAGHRDSFFRELRNVRRRDQITIQTPDRDYAYEVESTRIVEPKDVEVLAPTKDATLTLVTCYPFYYVGNAPKRFIVRARQVTATQRAAQGS